MNQSGSLSALLPIVVVAVVFALRVRRMSRSRPLQHQRLWVLPAVVLAGVVAVLVLYPPALYGWAALAAGLVLGAPIGWWRGRFTHIERDAETGALMMRQSWAAVALFVAVLLLRQLARIEMMDDTGVGHAARLMLLSDGLMGLAFGLISLQRLEMWLRARRLISA